MKYSFLLLLALIVITSCSRKSEEDLLKDANVAIEQKNFEPGVQSLQQLIDEYPKGAHAERAQLLIANLYQNNIKDFEKAVAAYDRFFQLFPGSKDAPNALFLKAFILNNELQQYDRAKIAYQSFLEKYPDHDLAASARFEMENLGKSPDDLLKTEVAEGEKTPPAGAKKPAAK